MIKVCPYVCECEVDKSGVCLTAYESCHGWFMKYKESLRFEARERELGIGAIVDWAHIDSHGNLQGRGESENIPS